MLLFNYSFRFFYSDSELNVDVKTLTVPTTTRKRYSVSMFDEVEVQPIQQQPQKVLIVDSYN